jgi:hypothetical protein
MAALEAEDPFVELDTFRERAGNYGAKCKSLLNAIYNKKPAPCKTRANVENKSLWP